MSAPTPDLVPPSANALQWRRWFVFGATWVLLSLLMIAWAVATPISASPDEPAHMVKAASVVRGQFIGEPSEYGHDVQVPRYVASTHAETCFAFNSAVPASCSIPLAGESSEIIDSTTTAGRYNPVYYAVVGWPTLIVGDVAGLYAMRVVSAMLTALFVALTVLIGLSWKAPALLLGAVGVAIPPMVLFLGGSVNPNAVEATATLAIFAAMLSIIVKPDERLLMERSMIVLAGSVFAMNARAISPLWVAIAIGVPLLMVSARQLRELLQRRAVQAAIIGTAAAAAFAVGWILSSSSLTAGMGGGGTVNEFPGVGSSAIAGFGLTLRDFFAYAQSMIGIFGWLDTPAPLATYFVWSALSGALLLAAVAVLRGRRLVVATVVVGLFVLLPGIIQGIYITGGGVIWQGRYALPLFAMAAFALAAMLSEQVDALPRPAITRLAFLVWVAWAAAQFAAFATALRRYVVGSNGTWRDLLAEPAWMPPGGIALVLALFTCGILLTAYAAWRLGTQVEVRAIRLDSPARFEPILP